MERVVRNQKLSSKLFMPIVLKHTNVLLEVLKIKFNGCVVVFWQKVLVLQLLKVMVMSVVNNVPVAKYYFRTIGLPKRHSYLSTFCIMATIDYPCACQKEEGVVGADTVVWKQGMVAWEVSWTTLFFEALGLYCTSSVIYLTALFKDGEQKAELSVTVPVLNGLEERLVLWEMATCGDRSCGGKSVWKESVCTCLTQDMWMDRHREAQWSYIYMIVHTEFAWRRLSILL